MQAALVLTNEGIHGMRSAGDDNPNNQEHSANQCNISSAHKVGQRPNEWTDGGQCQQVG